MSYQNSSLWKAAFQSASDQGHAESLSTSLIRMREVVKLLVGEIHSDLRDFTVHDIEHLDALWNIASEIVGPHYTLTPTEGFVLGGAILLHDAGLTAAAYPGGLTEISSNVRWPTILARHAEIPGKPTDAEIRSAKIDFLRSEHANRSSELPSVKWASSEGDRLLLENAELRQKFGQFIGEVAASHWRSQSELVTTLNRIVPAPPPFPSGWSIDLLKVASILRAADAAHLDERRAPGFLFALRRTQLSEEALRHWTFQNRLTQPERRGDAIYYSSTSDFTEAEAESWWLAHDMLRGVDRELRDTDALLADFRTDALRFSARRVANIDSPDALTRSLGVTGWVPIDTRVHIHDVVSLISRLGGSALYGHNPIVPVRELIQNSADAIRLRRAIEGKEEGGLITVKYVKDENNEMIEVTDDGVGMSAAIIQNYLLNFGESGWKNDPSLNEYSRVPPVNLTGKFGIGFFSSFMLGNEVDILTRRFDYGYDETLLLRFNQGLAARPILKKASHADRMILPRGGTRVRIRLRPNSRAQSDSPILDHGPLDPEVSEIKFKELGALCAETFPALDVPITIVAAGRVTEINGRDWQVEPAEELIKRLKGTHDELSKGERRFIRNLNPILSNDGQIVGRLCIKPFITSRDFTAARIVVGGVAVSSVRGFMGVICGKVSSAARDVAKVEVDGAEFDNWITEQNRLLVKEKLRPAVQAECAGTILSLGGIPQGLKICRTNKGWLDYDELKSFIRSVNEVYIVDDSEIDDDDRMRYSLLDNVVEIDTFGSFIDRTVFSNITSKRMLQLLATIMNEAWGIDEVLLNKYFGEMGDEDDYELRHVIGSDNSGELLYGDAFWVPSSFDEVEFERMHARAKQEQIQRQPRG